jgi:Trk-type K+ transport systems, membrane components
VNGQSIDNDERGELMTFYLNWQASVSLLGTIVKYLALTMLVPLAVAVIYGEDIWVFVASLVIALLIGLALERVDTDPDLGPTEALLLVSLSWLAVAVIGAVPYLIAGYGTESTLGLDLSSTGALVGSVINALFESMSGFTTTGATVLGSISVDSHSHALMLWRQLTQWLGGNGDHCPDDRYPPGACGQRRGADEIGVPGA